VPTKNRYNTLFGFDFGMKRIGVAIGQTITQTARPLTTLAAIQGLPSVKDVQTLINQWHPDAFVIGIPLNMDGTEQPVTEAARRLQHWLSEQFKLPVHTIDERLSTRDAREQIYNAGGFRALQKAKVDSFAAQIILQDWLTQDHST